MFTIPRPCRRLQIAWVVGLLSVTTAVTGCQPQGARSISVGDPAHWRKPPVAPSKKAPTRIVRTKGQDNPPAYKSIKEHLRQAGRKP
jgi:hypothetical protein